MIQKLGIVYIFLSAILFCQKTNTILIFESGDRLIFSHTTNWKTVVSNFENRDSINFSSVNGYDFLMLIVVPKETNSSKFLGLKKNVIQMGRQFLPTATQSNLLISEIKGTNLIGNFFHLSDKRPLIGEGQYKEMREGIVEISDYKIYVALLTHTVDGGTVREALTMWKHIIFEKNNK